MIFDRKKSCISRNNRCWPYYAVLEKYLPPKTNPTNPNDSATRFPSPRSFSHRQQGTLTDIFPRKNRKENKNRKEKDIQWRSFFFFKKFFWMSRHAWPKGGKDTKTKQWLGFLHFGFPWRRKKSSSWILLCPTYFLFFFFFLFYFYFSWRGNNNNNGNNNMFSFFFYFFSFIVF